MGPRKRLPIDVSQPKGRLPRLTGYLTNRRAARRIAPTTAVVARMTAIAAAADSTSAPHETPPVDLRAANRSASPEDSGLAESCGCLDSSRAGVRLATRFGEEPRTVRLQCRRDKRAARHRNCRERALALCADDWQGCRRLPLRHADNRGRLFSSRISPNRGIHGTRRA